LGWVHGQNTDNLTINVVTDTGFMPELTIEVAGWEGQSCESWEDDIDYHHDVDGGSHDERDPRQHLLLAHPRSLARIVIHEKPSKARFHSRLVGTVSHLPPNSGGAEPEQKRQSEVEENERENHYDQGECIINDFARYGLAHIH